MLPHGRFPLQVVDLVIGQLADAHEHNIKLYPLRYKGTCKTLRSCALTSKKWADRSRARLFEKVKVEVREGRPTLFPPPSILPHIKKLEVICSQQSFGSFWPPHEPSTPDLLNAFLTAPIERLRITRGALADQRVCIQGFIEAHSATLQTVEFDYCSLSTHNISDIVLGNRCIKRLHLADCNSPPGCLTTDTPGPGTCSKVADLELYISGEDWESGPMDMAIMIAQLPYRFSKLEIDHFPTEESHEAMTATSGMIKANAETLSSLRIHIFAEDIDIEIEPKHLPSLDSCSNLSDLILDMERSPCSFNDCVSILSTLDPARSSRLEKIVLEVTYLEWFSKDGPAEDEEDEGALGDDSPAGRKKRWEGLDAVLSDLAEATMRPRDERLTFTLVVLRGWRDNRELMPTMRKWLPKLLPRFNELGLLHVHYMRGGHCRTVNDGCLGHEKPGCLAEDFKDSY